MNHRILGAMLLAVPATAQNRAVCEDHREARAALTRLPGVRIIRLLGPDQSATMDCVRTA